MTERIHPVIKWAGGKTQLLDIIIPMIPEITGTYYEPFLGGGAVLLALQPDNVFVGDLNQALCQTYTQAAWYPDAVLADLSRLDSGLREAEDPTKFYLDAREEYNRYVSAHETGFVPVGNYMLGALFIFLNKHCFNGLYRTNKKGGFNVPYNKSLADSVDPDNFRRLSSYLKENQVTIRQGNYRETTWDAKAGDFIFFDPPYDDTFTGYTAASFTPENQEDLGNLFRELTERGCKCMLTNSNTGRIRNIYAGYNIKEVDVRRSINRNGHNRTGQEVIVTNY